MRRIVTSAVAALIAASPLAFAQTVSKAASVSATATIQAIDKANRVITIRDEKGVEDAFSVGPEVKRFDELNVGDKVKLTYSESLVLHVRKPGDPAPTAGDQVGGARSTGAPGATIARQLTTTVEVLAIDQKLPSITVKTADGRTVTRKVENRKNLEGVKVGDKIDITYTQAAVLEIEPIK
jgi:Cu/Ag efflux protein CusF